MMSFDFDREEKNRIRDLALPKVSAPTKAFLDLPAGGCLSTKQAKRNGIIGKDTKVVLLEKHADIIPEIKNSLIGVVKESNYRIINSDFAKMGLDGLPQFDYLNLDFCGVMTPQILKVLFRLSSFEQKFTSVSNKSSIIEYNFDKSLISENATINLTFSLTNRSKHYDAALNVFGTPGYAELISMFESQSLIPRQIVEDAENSDDCRILNIMLMLNLALIGRKFEYKYVDKYKDTSPMVFIQIKLKGVCFHTAISNMSQVAFTCIDHYDDIYSHGFACSYRF